MAKKRKSSGRKGHGGSSHNVQCSRCFRQVPIDKAKKITKRVSLIDRETEDEIRKQHGYIQSKIITSYLCISCAVHTHKANIRQKTFRDSERVEFEQRNSTRDTLRGLKQKDYGDRRNEKDRRNEYRRTSERKEKTR